MDYYEIEGIKLKDVKNASTLFSGFLKKVKYKINGSIYVMVDESDKIANIFRQMALEGKNDLYVEYIEEVLHAMSNRDFQGMKELDVKMIDKRMRQTI